MEISTQEVIISSDQNLSSKASAIIRTLLYFDIFHYPLTLAEIIDNCQFQKIDKAEAEAELQKLIQKKCIRISGKLYFISEDFSLEERRIKGNEEAVKKMKVAQRMSDFISNFPFVQSVSISGSLSKNYMDKDSDIDFFIITAAQRLWLCRGLLVMFKKIFLFNSRKHFCINYYLDTDNLEIPDRNIFTATEIAFLKPTYNPIVFKRFTEQNRWCAEFYPNKKKIEFDGAPLNQGLVKRSLEYLLEGFLGEKLDSLFFHLTLKRWKKKFPHFNEEEFDLNLRSRKHVSKHHPRGYQKIVLESFQKKISNFEMQYNVKLH